jgi:DNA invertase Pin-like site-specific DNA recombinase
MRRKSAPLAYSYLRFSTPEQARGDSLRRQTALAEAYAKRQGLQLDTELSLRDLGVSAFRGANAAVGALGAFLKAVGDGLVPKGSLLLVEALDRVSRQTARKAVRTLEEIVEAGITVVTLNDGKQYTEASLNGTDFLLAILLFMRGAEESETKSKRLKAAWTEKRKRAAQGEIQTVRAPAWILAEGSGSLRFKNATLCLIPQRAKLIQRMFRMFLAGTGKRGIAKAFNREGIRPWGAGKGRKPGKFWQPTYVYRCLTNPAVTGRLVPHIERHEGKLTREPQSPIEDYYPRVVSDDDFQRVQALRGARRKSVRSGRVASVVAGLAQCPKCGSTMTRFTRGGDRPGEPKLVCVRAKAGAGCKYHAVSLPDVEKALIDHAWMLRKPPMADESLAEEIDAAEEELYEVSKQVKSLVNGIERGPSAALSKRLAERETQAAKITADLKGLEERAAETESRVVALRAKRLGDALTLGLKPETLAAANSALREAVEFMTVDYVEGVLRLKWRHGPETEIRYGVGQMFKDLDRESRVA